MQLRTRTDIITVTFRELTRSEAKLIARAKPVVAALYGMRCGVARFAKSVPSFADLVPFVAASSGIDEETLNQAPFSTFMKIVDASVRANQDHFPVPSYEHLEEMERKLDELIDRLE